MPSAPTCMAGLQDVLDRDVPAWSIWYDTEWSAIADRVHGPDGAIDTSLPGLSLGHPQLDPGGPGPGGLPQSLIG